MSAASAAGQAVYEKLKEIFGPDRVSNDEAKLIEYSHDQTEAKPAKPSFIVWAKTTEEVVALVKYANEAELPITPRVAGTNLGGLTIPSEGGLLLDLSQMNKILEFDEVEQYVVIEPGVSFKQLKEYFAEIGKNYLVSIPLAPPEVGITPNCLLDGLGNLSFRYGTMAEWVNGAEMVLPTGEVMKTGSCALVDSWHSRAPLPDLMGLFTNFQGTTGICTKMSVQVVPDHPYRRRTFMLTYSYEACFSLIRKLSRYNLWDDIGGLSWPTAKLMFGVDKPAPRDETEPLMFLYLDFSADNETELELKNSYLQSILQSERANGMVIEDPLDVDVLVRVNPLFASFAEFPTRLTFLVDYPGGGLSWVGTYGPTKNWEEGCKRGEKIMWKHGFPPTTVNRPMKGGHFAVMRFIEIFDIEDPDALKRVAQCNIDLIHMALDLNFIPYKATSTAVKIFRDKIDPVYMDMLHKIKAMLDPKGILNPGKWLLGVDEE